MKQKTFKHKITILACLTALLVFTMCARKTDLQKGVEAVRKGEYAKALEPLHKALSIESHNQEALYNLSLAYAYLDSVDKSFHHYLTLVDLQSPFKDSMQLKEILIHFLSLEPYVWHLVPMKMNHQFKGVMNPNGQTIAVAAAQRDRPNIYLISLDGSIIKKITKSGMNTDPDFSPTGTHLVFVSDVDGDEELYLYTIQDGQIEKLTNNTAQDFSPSFSPDGNDIVFISNMHDKFKWEIYKTPRNFPHVSASYHAHQVDLINKGKSRFPAISYPDVLLIIIYSLLYKCTSCCGKGMEIPSTSKRFLMFSWVAKNTFQ